MLDRTEFVIDGEKSRELINWLMREARLLDNAVATVEQLGSRLIELGVPLWRLRVAQRVANPLLTAWGVIWHADGRPTQEYVVPHEWLQTSTWIGSPFEYVSENRQSFRRRLTELGEMADHGVLHELKDEGATDFIALTLEYGDGSVQGMSLVTDHPDGFSDAHIALFEEMRHPLAGALEPVAMRQSMKSLLQTYLGTGPSASVVNGSINRGDRSVLRAVVMFSDLRDFTQKSSTLSDADLLEALNQYFGIMVDAVRASNGDVLKFLGDGVLAVFPIDETTSAEQRVSDALDAIIEARRTLAIHNELRAAEGEEPLAFGTALHIGDVTYGNIGSADRLDFTVIGETVNTASRAEGLTKILDEPVLCTGAIVDHSDRDFRSVGLHTVRGLRAPLPLFVPHGRLQK